MCFSSRTSLFTRLDKEKKDHFAYQAELLLNSTVHPGYLQVSLIPALKHLDGGAGGGERSGRQMGWELNSLA